MSVLESTARENEASWPLVHWLTNAWPSEESVRLRTTTSGNWAALGSRAGLRFGRVSAAAVPGAGAGEASAPTALSAFLRTIAPFRRVSATRSREISRWIARNPTVVPRDEGRRTMAAPREREFSEPVVWWCKPFSSRKSRVRLVGVKLKWGVTSELLLSPQWPQPL